MSKGDTTFERKLFRSNEHEEIITHTLQSMLIPQEEKEKYIKETHIRYARRKLVIAFDYRKKSVFQDNYSLLKQNNILTRKDKLLNLFIYYTPAYTLFIFLKSIVKK